MILDLFMSLIGGGYAAGKTAQESYRRAAERKYVRDMGFNEERQHQLQMMAHSYYQSERDKFDKLAGRPVDRHNEYDVLAAYKEIAKKEGWRYCDIGQLSKDAAYMRIIGAKRKY